LVFSFFARCILFRFRANLNSFDTHVVPSCGCNSNMPECISVATRGQLDHIRAADGKADGRCSSCNFHLKAFVKSLSTVLRQCSHRHPCDSPFSFSSLNVFHVRACVQRSVTTFTKVLFIEGTKIVMIFLWGTTVRKVAIQFIHEENSSDWE
jgi:hypothetical protein